MESEYVWVDMNTGRVCDPDAPYVPFRMPPPPPIPIEESVKRIRINFDPIYSTLNRLEW
jgi:hypothetical protein